MILSRGRRYLFIHIPKTGGTSMALALEARAKKDDIMLGDTPKARNRRRRVKDVRSSGRLWKHSRLTDLYGLAEEEEIESFFIFTLVRNPWDRLVSYYHWLKEQRFEHPAVDLARALSFSEFLNHDHTKASIRGMPYGLYVTNRHGVERCNAFVRLEHLDDDLAPVARHLGFVPEMPHVNRSERGAYREAYSAKDRDLVAEICAVDIARFAYQF